LTLVLPWLGTCVVAGASARAPLQLLAALDSKERSRCREVPTLTPEDPHLPGGVRQDLFTDNLLV